MENYVLYHLHSDLSNAVTNIDSVTKYQSHVDAARACGMKAMGFSEHGSIFEWWHKKNAIEAAGMKYLHGVEAYVTEFDTEKVRDNYHCVLIAKNYDGFLELNRLVSESFNRNDAHFYYTPRIFLKDLLKTSPNILVTTACIAGIFGKGSDSAKEKMLEFIVDNKQRCFLEVQHHPDPKQAKYNQYMAELSQKTGVRLIAGTDTHVLNETHAEGRSLLQRAKNVFFDGEDGFDLTFKTLPELIGAFQKQGALPYGAFMEAIENTNVMADMVEPFEVDCDIKYPHIFDDPERVFRQKVYAAIDSHPYALKNHTREELVKAVEEELAVYKATKSIDFMLMRTYLHEQEIARGIRSGYGRGSVSGSIIAYLLGITDMDSLRFDLNFFRFMNPSRVTNADIDTDYGGADRDWVKEFLLKDKMGLDNIKSAEIITFNTIQTKGAIRDVCRGLYGGVKGDNSYLQTADQVCELTERDEEEARRKYPEVFKYVDIVNGTIVSVGTHPSGVLVSDLPIEELISTCSLSSTPYPVSALNMKELDDLKYVKLDILGLDNISVINETCKMAGIERLTPDNVDMEDEAVWEDLRDDTTLIFQWESNSAQSYIRRFMSDKTLKIARQRIPNFSMLKWLSFGNGLLRPACASFRDSVAKGEFYDNGFDALNEFLAPEAGRIAMQETIMKFLVQFCGYSASESDNVRRAIAKKKGTETLLPEIERRFIDFSTEKYGISTEKAESVIKPFLQIIVDASSYAFSWNHSDAYSCIGYISAYLRHYYPYEFLTAALNVFSDDVEKTGRISSYAGRHGITVTSPKWGISGNSYAYNKEKHAIAKGVTSIKYMSSSVAEELLDLARKNEYKTFISLLYDIDSKTSVTTRQLDILIKLDFFSDFGNQRELLWITSLFYDLFKRGDAKKMQRDAVAGTPFEPIIQKYSVGELKSGGISKQYALFDNRSALEECEAVVKAANLSDLSDVEKVKNFVEYVGYAGYVTGREEDRRKLLITKVSPLKRKSDGRQFGYSLVTMSIGSGKESRFTVVKKLYDATPVVKDDIIYCNAYERENGFFKLTGYRKLA